MKGFGRKKKKYKSIQMGNTGKEKMASKILETGKEIDKEVTDLRDPRKPAVGKAENQPSLL